MSRRRMIWTGWALALCGVLIGLGLQVGYYAGVADCTRDSEGLLALCAGPLASWVLPVTLAVGIGLVGAALVRLAGRQEHDGAGE